MLNKQIENGSWFFWTEKPVEQFSPIKRSKICLKCIRNSETNEFYSVIEFDQTVSDELIDGIFALIMQIGEWDLRKVIDKVDEIFSRKLHREKIIGIVGEVFVISKQFPDLIDSWDPLQDHPIDLCSFGNRVEVKSSLAQDATFKIKYKQHKMSCPDNYAFVKMIEDRISGLSAAEIVEKYVPESYMQKQELLLWVNDNDNENIRFDFDRFTCKVCESAALKIDFTLERPIDDAVFDVKYSDLT